jgi:thioredoxin-related protein
MRRFAGSVHTFALLVLFALPATASHAGGVAWRNWNDGMTAAAGSHKPVIVDVYTDWCGWCKRMDRDVYTDAAVRAYLTQKLVTIKLDAEADDAAHYEGQAITSALIARRFGISGYPATVFLHPDGKPIVTVPGYLPAPEFLQLVKYVGEGYYERGVDFEAYKQGHTER